MKLSEIINIANESYPDSLVSKNFNPKTGKATTNHHGDGLANFIVRELVDTYDRKAKDGDQLLEAERVMNRASRELGSVASWFGRKAS